MNEPVVAISETSKNKFEEECKKFFLKGYILDSSSCVAYGYQDNITEVWQAILVLPSVKDG